MCSGGNGSADHLMVEKDTGPCDDGTSEFQLLQDLPLQTFDCIVMDMDIAGPCNDGTSELQLLQDCHCSLRSTLFG